MLYKLWFITAQINKKYRLKVKDPISFPYYAGVS